MSHVSENALEGDTDVIELRKRSELNIAEERRPLSEIAAFFIVRSPGFRRLLDLAWERSRLPPLTWDAVEFVSKGIIGVPIDEDVPLLHEIITGPLDADKLDYLKARCLLLWDPGCCRHRSIDPKGACRLDRMAKSSERIGGIFTEARAVRHYRNGAVRRSNVRRTCAGTSTSTRQGIQAPQGREPKEW